jgi:translocator protein
MSTMGKPAQGTSPWLRLAAAALPVIAAWGAASLATPAGTAWFQELPKPGFTPPAWMFGPVWTVLYLMMIYVAWRILGLPASRGRSRALVIFYLQLVVNAAWSFAFFVGQSPIAGLVVIGLLTALVLGAIVAFWRVDRPSGVLFIPYAAWLLYAGAINLGIVLMT